MPVAIPDTHLAEAQRSLRAAEAALVQARECLRVGPGKRARPDTASDHLASVAASLDSAHVALYAIWRSARSANEG